MTDIAEKSKSRATERAAGAAHAAVDSAAARAEKLERQLRESMDSAGERIGHKKESASQQVQEALEKVEKFTNERPLAATGIAFAAGIFAASLLRRK